MLQKGCCRRDIAEEISQEGSRGRVEGELSRESCRGRCQRGMTRKDAVELRYGEGDIEEMSRGV